LADVAGHGMQAAIPMVLFCGILKSQMEVTESMEQLLGRLNRTLSDTIERRALVCFTMGELDLKERTLRLSNCGCPYPYHYRAATGDVVELEIEAYPLGVRFKDNYPVHDIQLTAGDYVVLCSDGIIEASNGNEQEIFGFERTSETIQQACTEGINARALIDRVVQAVEQYSNGVPQGDDRTIVVLRVER